MKKLIEAVIKDTIGLGEEVKNLHTSIAEKAKAHLDSAHANHSAYLDSENKKGGAGKDESRDHKTLGKNVSGLKTEIDHAHKRGDHAALKFAHDRASHIHEVSKKNGGGNIMDNERDSGDAHGVMVSRRHGDLKSHHMHALAKTGYGRSMDKHGHEARAAQHHGLAKREASPDKKAAHERNAKYHEERARVPNDNHFKP